MTAPLRPPLARHAVLHTLLAVLVMLFGLPGPTAAQVRATLLDQSRITLSGTSSVNTFSCTAGRVRGTGLYDQTSIRTEATVTVPVEAFDCGNSRMNSDLYEALHSDTHPHIGFALDTVVLGSEPRDHEGRLVQATGHLRIAGTARPIVLRLQGHPAANGTYRAQGSVALRMSDFGVTPPHALMGLIRVHDAITVHFDLHAQVDSAGATR